MKRFFYILLDVNIAMPNNSRDRSLSFTFKNIHSTTVAAFFLYLFIMAALIIIGNQLARQRCAK